MQISRSTLCRPPSTTIHFRKITNQDLSELGAANEAWSSWVVIGLLSSRHQNCARYNQEFLFLMDAGYLLQRGAATMSGKGKKVALRRLLLFLVAPTKRRKTW